jgi:hypothetical protein
MVTPTPQRTTELEPGDQWAECHRRPGNEAPLGRPTPADADVSEFRHRILMQRSASPFVISNAVRGTWLGAGTHPRVGQIAEYLQLSAFGRRLHLRRRSPGSACPLGLPHRREGGFRRGASSAGCHWSRIRGPLRLFGAVLLAASRVQTAGTPDRFALQSSGALARREGRIAAACRCAGRCGPGRR